QPPSTPTTTAPFGTSATTSRRTRRATRRRSARSRCPAVGEPSFFLFDRLRVERNFDPGENSPILCLRIDRQPNVLGSARAPVHDKARNVRRDWTVWVQTEKRRRRRERVVDSEH